ncbi:MAG: hypothetical protein MUP76_08720 [Acidimicrobiia bacterium]|nr:hypothetical protein [Acidimicrobiia bacterium]
MTATAESPGFPTKPRVPSFWATVWTRGEGCEDLAHSLAERDPIHVEGDLRAACIAARAGIIVTTKLTSFDLLPMVVPSGVDFQKIRSVVAAVGSGPHSILAARVAVRLARSIGVEGSMVSVSPTPDHDAAALQTLDHISTQVPGISATLVREPGARALVDDLPPDAVLVIGAPGGSWLQRQFFGPGRQLVVHSKAGAIVVRDAPRRCFHHAGEPSALGARLLIADARPLAVDPAMAVVDEGQLVGIVRRERLAAAPPDDAIESIMEDAVFLQVDDPVDAAGDLASFLDGSPIPVIDANGRLAGSLTPPD